MILHSCPQIPDRTSYILGKSGENPFPALARIGKELMGQGADVIAIPCVTAHYFQRKLEEEIEIPILNAVEETAVCLEEAGVTRAGILATHNMIQVIQYMILHYLPPEIINIYTLRLIRKGT